MTPFAVFAVFPNEDRFILFFINAKGDIPRIKTKKRAFLLSFYGRIEWTRTTDPHLIRVVL